LPGRRSAEGPDPTGFRGMNGELLVVAVEASADLHRSRRAAQLRALRPGCARSARRPLLRAEGCEPGPREDLSVMGFAEVLPAIPRIFRALRTLRRRRRSGSRARRSSSDQPRFSTCARPQAATWASGGVFIGPSVWAWRTYRVRQIARDVARMLVILPSRRSSMPATESRRCTRQSVRTASEPYPRLALALPSPHSTLDPPATSAAPSARALHPACSPPRSRRQEVLLFAALLAAPRAPRPHPPTSSSPPVAAPCAGSGFPRDLPVPSWTAAPGRSRRRRRGVVASGTATSGSRARAGHHVVVYRLSWLSWISGGSSCASPSVLVNLLAAAGWSPSCSARLHRRRIGRARHRSSPPRGAGRSARGDAADPRGLAPGLAGSRAPRRAGVSRLSETTRSKPAAPASFLPPTTSGELPMSAILAASAELDVLGVDDDSHGTGPSPTSWPPASRASGSCTARARRPGRAYWPASRWRSPGYGRSEWTYFSRARTVPALLAPRARSHVVLAAGTSPGRDPNWGLDGPALARRSVYARTILGVRVHDLPADSMLRAKCWRNRSAHRHQRRLAFHVELTYRALRAGFRVWKSPSFRRPPRRPEANSRAIVSRPWKVG